MDWAVYHGAKPGAPIQLQPGLTFQGVGWAVVGIQKLVQRFVLLLLTPRESFPYIPERGCLFMPLLLHGRIQTPADLYAAYAASMLQVLPQMRGWEAPSDPPEERLESADLQQVELAGDTVRLHIRIRSQAGEEASFSLPFRDFRGSHVIGSDS